MRDQMTYKKDIGVQYVLEIEISIKDIAFP